jgi:glycerol uptake facilitator-like aquaporin
MSKPSLTKRVFCEALGTAALVTAVVGSGIMGERLAGGNVALALLANTIAAGAVLVVLVLACAQVSGAHLNPAVSLSASLRGVLPWQEVPHYVAGQFIGGVLGTFLAHVMFAQQWYSFSHRPRSGIAQVASEFVATFGLVCVIWACVHTGSVLNVAIAVGAYITAAYWFTASTSFANPAVTLARSLTGSFSGIRLVDVPGFIAAQLTGAAAATVVVQWFLREEIIVTAPLPESPTPSTDALPQE